MHIYLGLFIMYELVMKVLPMATLIALDWKRERKNIAVIGDTPSMFNHQTFKYSQEMTILQRYLDI